MNLIQVLWRMTESKLFGTVAVLFFSLQTLIGSHVLNLFRDGLKGTMLDRKSVVPNDGVTGWMAMST